MNLLEEFKEWENKKNEEKIEKIKEQLNKKDKELKEIGEKVKTYESIEVKSIEKLNGDRGFFAKGKILRYKFTAGCVDGNWFKGWNVGSIKGLELGEEYRRLSKLISEYLNREYPKGEKK